MALPTFPIGFDFRGTLGYATDVAPNVFAGSSVAFNDSVGYGWTATAGLSMENRGAVGGPAKLAGAATVHNASISAPAVWRVNVDPAKSYKLRMALGDGLYSYPYGRIRVYDGAGTTPILSVNGIEAGQVDGEYIDATGVRRNNYAAWEADNLPATLTASSGHFRVEVGLVGGISFSGLSHLALVEVPAAPTITDEPDSIEVSQPATATFSATVGGAYTGLQWQTRPNSGGTVTDVAGAVGTSYTTGPTDLSMSGRQYRLAVAWADGPLYSAWATLTVNAGPAGVVSDVTGTATGGTTATVSFTPGTPAATSHTLELETPQGAGNWTAPASTLAGSVFSVTGLGGATEYRPRVRASNVAGTSAWVVGAAFTTDNVATGGAEIPVVTVPDVPPAITTHPQAATRVEGQSVTLTGAASGTPTPTLQWQRNSGSGWADISSATGSSYTLTAALADNGAQFRLVATNSEGTAQSNAAALTVTAAPVAPTITAQPQPRAVLEGASATFTVAATGTAPLAYQWRMNGTDIAGATASTYTRVTALADTGAAITVRVSNVAGAVVSQAATLTVSEVVAPPPNTILLDDCLKRMLPYVPGCPDQTAKVHLRDAAADFCEKSMAWKTDLTATTVAGQATYTIPLPAGALLVKLLQYALGDDHRAGLPGPSRGRDMQRSTSGMDVAWTDDRVTVTLNPVPATAGEVIHLWVALKPSDEVETLPLEIWSHHARTLEAGALSTLMLMPNQPWSNPGLASVNSTKFEDRCDTAAATAARGHSRAGGRVKPFLV